MKVKPIFEDYQDLEEFSMHTETLTERIKESGRLLYKKVDEYIAKMSSLKWTILHEFTNTAEGKSSNYYTQILEVLYEGLEITNKSIV